MVPSQLTRLPILCARLGLCSRAEAARYIRLGLVAVDGLVAKSAAELVPATAEVALLPRGQRMQAAKVTIALHKPLHYATCRARAGTPSARALLVPENRAWACRTRHDPRQLSGLAAADVLDDTAQGLVIFSQDGRVATRVSRDPGLDKEYCLYLPGDTTSSQLAALQAGLLHAAFDASQGGSGRSSGNAGGRDEAILVDSGGDTAAADDGGAATTVECGSEEPQEDGSLLLRLLVRGALPSVKLRQSCMLAGLPNAVVARTRIGRLKLEDLPQRQWTIVRGADILE